MRLSKTDILTALFKVAEGLKNARKTGAVDVDPVLLMVARKILERWVAPPDIVRDYPKLINRNRDVKRMVRFLSCCKSQSRLTGSGKREALKIAEVLEFSARAMDYCDRADSRGPDKGLIEL